MKESSRVYIVIVNWNRRELLAQCLTSIRDNTDYPDFRVVVVDNGSADGSPRMVRKDFPWVELIENQMNMGFAKANNQGIKKALENNSDFVFLLNDDTVIVDRNWLRKMVEFFDAYPKAGVISCNMIYPDGRIQPVGGMFSVRLSEPDLRPTDIVKEVDIAFGAAMMVKREVLEKIGLFDEGFSPVYGEDTEYSLRAKMAGYKIMYNPRTTIMHVRGGTRKALLSSLQESYFGHKGAIRLMLLYFPAIWLLKRIGYEGKVFLSFTVEKKDETRKLSLFNARLHKSTGLWLKMYFKAFWENFKVLDDIIRQRLNRTRKIWY